MPAVKPVTLIALERTYDSKIRAMMPLVVMIVFNKSESYKHKKRYRVEMQYFAPVRK
jgi:predicted proteasome-type protease